MSAPSRPGRPVIEVAGVSKRYRRAPGGGPRRLRHLSDLVGRVDHWALRDVAFTVAEGDTVGLVGANGSGKSTLLRLLAGLSRPTSGAIDVRRRVSGLLTLGESFQPTLTGEENAITGAVLAGLSRREARRRLPDVAAFAELDDVLDQPLRTYSDGMRLRLAFAVSVHVDPEILLVDEILAVGDLRFRRRCLDLVDDLRASGVTTIVSTHDMGQIVERCERAIWLGGGRVRADGPAAEVAERYQAAMAGDLVERSLDGEGVRIGTGQEVEITAVRLLATAPDAAGPAAIAAGAPLVVEVDFVAHAAVPDAIFVVSAHPEGGGSPSFDLNTDADRQRVGRLDGPGTLRLRLDRLDLSSGRYQLDVGIYERAWARPYDYRWAAAPFDVIGTGSSGVLDPPRRWERA